MVYEVDRIISTLPNINFYFKNKQTFEITLKF